MQHDALQAEIDALTDHRADLYRLHRRVPEDTVCAEEISQITGYTLSNIKVKLFRARKHLYTIIKEKMNYQTTDLL